MFFMASMVGWTRADETVPVLATAQSKSEAEQIKSIASRLETEDEQRCLSGVFWTLLHCTDEAHLKLVVKTIGASMEDQKEYSFESAVRDAGGLTKYRDRVTRLLDNDSEIVRGFGAHWLGVVGDETSKKDLYRLLKAKNLHIQDEAFAGYDRAAAASALGRLGAREYLKDFAALLHDPNDQVQAGTARAIGSLKAKEYSAAIAELVEDGRDRACMAAIVTLVDLGAKQYAPVIAKRLTSHGDPSIPEYAIYALAALDAKEQSKDIATLLGNQYKGGHAALALALLDAKEYLPQIRELMNNGGGLTRRDAVLALGIFQNKQDIPTMARLMQDSEDYVRVGAAWAIIMLEDRPHAPQAIRILEQNGKDHIADHFPLPHGAQFIASAQFRREKERAVKLYRKFKAIEQNETHKSQ